MNATDVLALAPDQIAALPSHQIPALITAAIRLDRTIKEQENLLATFKDRLKAEAEQYLNAEGIKDLAGSNWEQTGLDGNTVQVTFPEPGLVRNFWLHDDQAFCYRGKLLVKLGPIQKLAGEQFKKLFQNLYKPAKAFRELVKIALTPAAAAKLIALLEEPSPPRVSFKTKAE